MTWNKLRRLVAMTSTSLVLAGFVGLLAAIAGRLAFNLSEEGALLGIGLPISILIGIWVWPKMGRVTGFEN